MTDVNLWVHSAIPSSHIRRHDAGMRRQRAALVLLGLAVAVGIAFVTCLQFGAEPIKLVRTMRALGEAVFPGGAIDRMTDTDTFIVVHLRVPRLLLALCVGGILSLVGACLQGLLRNPLADPYVLGISSGATLGATLALTVGTVSAALGGIGVTVCALVGGLVVMIVLYRLSSSDGRLPLPTVLLLGVVINAILSAMAMFVTSVLSPEHLARVLSWLMGSLAAVDSWRLALTAVALLVGMGITMHHARHLNGLLVGDETAQSIGIPVEGVKRTLFLTCATLTGVAVAVSGMVGFVGMVVPHALRLLIGSDHRLLLPAVVLAGGGFLMCADTLARTMLAPSELPVGVVTALLGGPLFVHILLTHRHRETIGSRT